MPRDTLAELSDDTLLVLYANGDREASRLLTARLTPRLFGYAARLLGDRAEANGPCRVWRKRSNDPQKHDGAQKHRGIAQSAASAQWRAQPPMRVESHGATCSVSSAGRVIHEASPRNPWVPVSRKARPSKRTGPRL